MLGAVGLDRAALALGVVGLDGAALTRARRGHFRSSLLRAL
jgi:hypothetical protein